MYSDIDINTNGSSGLYFIFLPLQFVSICLILTSFPLLIGFTILKIIFLGHFVNLMFNLLANSLIIISLSINAILGSHSNLSNKFNTSFK